jgi:hypothetical protein
MFRDVFGCKALPRQYIYWKLDTIPVGHIATSRISFCPPSIFSVVIVMLMYVFMCGLPYNNQVMIEQFLLRRPSQERKKKERKKQETINKEGGSTAMPSTSHHIKPNSHLVPSPYCPVRHRLGDILS